MSPTLADQADTEILFSPHQPAFVYFWLMVTLAVGGPHLCRFCIHISQRKNWHPPTQWRELPAGYNPFRWLVTAALCWVIYDELSNFYGVRIHSDEVELLYVWPMVSVPIEMTNLVKVELTGTRKWQLRVSTRDGKRLSGTRVGYGRHEDCQEALNRIEAAVVQP